MSAPIVGSYLRTPSGWRRVVAIGPLGVEVAVGSPLDDRGIEGSGVPLPRIALGFSGSSVPLAMWVSPEAGI